jgi:hypothetical protein
VNTKNRNAQAFGVLLLLFGCLGVVLFFFLHFEGLFDNAGAVCGGLFLWAAILWSSYLGLRFVKATTTQEIAELLESFKDLYP